MSEKAIGRTDLVFWGGREYAHSSHIFPDFVDVLERSAFGLADKLVMDFRGRVSTNGDYVVLERSVPSAQCPVLIRAFYGDQTVTFGLIVKDQPIEKHQIDDEKELISQASINRQQRKGSIDVYDPDRLMSVLIALIKKVHLTSLPLSGFTRWMVGRIDIDLTVFKSGIGNPLSVEIMQNMADCMTRSQAGLGGQPFARVGFIRRKLFD